MSGDVYVIGASMTPFGKRLDETVKTLTASAVAAALSDAGLQTRDIQSAWFSNTRQPMLEGQNTIRGQIALRAAGIEGIPIINVENACASGSTAAHQAMTAIRAGMVDIALVVGAEKMVYKDRPEKVAAAFAGGTDIHDRQSVLDYIVAMGGETPGPDRSLFMDLYAAQAKVHMERFGTTVEDFARVASNTHGHGQHNLNAQYHTPFTVAEVLADKPIVDPFTRAMCAPVSDGAAALVLCNEAAARRLGISRAIRLRSIALLSTQSRDKLDYENHIGRRAATAAYNEASIDPRDIDVVEVHDATAFSTVQQIENLGLCNPGEVGRRLRDGDFALGGRTPVNPSGGLLAKGHPVGATGVAQLYELVTQLRGEADARQVTGARIGVAENGGGFLGVEEGVTTVAVLERVTQ
ncbi:thiolase family protein [Congregibacter litoralis]|uniref:propanoyl-CoA C-acyltransferase n=1 Tax=Congregibacter litoralis KT71 TaxID=314285 RepID=A4A359_9GAMM|nr:thiolase family protein [Congregibacter litoralis]EAQ99126.1 Acetyl-CoA acetyltransferase [Congregibacter litoralis KT71]